jgi:hypothetical protein
MEDVADADHRLVDTRAISDIADEEPKTLVGELPSHLVLLSLVAAENPDLVDGRWRVLDNCPAE